MTPYELLQVQALDRSRNNPVDAYSAGLLDLAKQRAYQRFKQQEATQEQAAALQRTRTAGELRIKEAQATAEGHAKAAIDALNQKEKYALKQEFASLHIAQNKGESDEDYLVRAGKEADRIRAQQLDTTYQSAEQYRTQANAIRRTAEAQRPQRVRDAAFEVVRSQLPPEVVKALNSDPTVRDSQLAVQFQNNSKLKDIKLLYEDALQKANQQVPVLTVDEDTKARGLDYRASQLESHAASLFTNPKYAGAIPEYTKILSDRSALGDNTDYDSVIKAAARKPSVAKPTKPAAASAPATPSELMPVGASVQDQGLLPTLWDRGAAAAVNVGSQLTPPAEAIGSFMRNPMRPLYQTGKFLFAGTNAPDVNAVFHAPDEIVNPSSYPSPVDQYLDALGVPRGFNVTAAGRPITPAELAAYRESRGMALRNRLPPPADTAFGPVTVPQTFGSPFGTPPPELTPLQ